MFEAVYSKVLGKLDSVYETKMNEVMSNATGMMEEQSGQTMNVNLNFNITPSSMLKKVIK